MLVDFIIPTFNRREPLISMLSSLLAQNDGDWTASVYIDTPEETSADEVVKLLNDKRIRFLHMSKCYNDWGHTPREIGKQSSEADYIVMTGDDNYYTPNFVKELRSAVYRKPGMVYWDMIHSHYGYTYFKCEPRTHAIDMGAFATRNDLAKQIKLGTNFAADGDFVEDFKKKFPKTEIKKINQVLFVHN